MSDKPVVQYELAGRLATLLHSPPKAQDTILFVQTFFKTMLREWAAIDKFRYAIKPTKAQLKKDTKL